MLTAGTVIFTLSFVWIFLVKNLDVSKTVQIKGVVFGELEDANFQHHALQDATFMVSVE